MNCEIGLRCFDYLTQHIGVKTSDWLAIGIYPKTANAWLTGSIPSSKHISILVQNGASPEWLLFGLGDVKFSFPFSKWLWSTRKMKYVCDNCENAVDKQTDFCSSCGHPMIKFLE